MSDRQPSLNAITGRPFAEQAAFFRQKMGNLTPTARWDDIQRGAHDTGFMVAGAAKADLLSDLAAATDRAINEGRGLNAFRSDFRDIVQRNGWHGWTGESSQAGRNWRTRVIYRTNARTSYAAGRHAQLAEADFAYWIYKHSGSRDPRPDHLAWDGLMLPPSHPFWRTHSPPNGFGCDCYVVGAHRPTSAQRLGGDPDKPLPPGWDDIDPESGAPPGVGTGWDYQPGARVAQTVTQMAEKTRQWEYEIAKAYMQGVPDNVRDSLATAYRALPSVADDARRYAQRVQQEGDAPGLPAYRTLGLLTQGDIRQVQRAQELDVSGYDYALDASAVRHVQRQHGGESERRRGQRPVTTQDYAMLPRLLNEGTEFAESGTSANNTPLVRRELTVGNETFVAVFEVRRRRQMLVLQTFYVRVRS